MNNSRAPLWVVVKVESGIPVLTEIYPNSKNARTRLLELRKEMNEDRDETALFMWKPGKAAAESAQ